MKIFFFFIALLCLYACEPSQSPEKERVEEKPKDELDKLTYEEVTKGAEQLLFSYQKLLNTLLAVDVTKEQRDDFVHNSIFSKGHQLHVFDSPDVIIEDDIGPEYYTKEKARDLKVSRYLSDLFLFLERSKANQVKFDNVHTLQVKVGEEMFVIVYFESQIQGAHSLEDFSYEKTKRIATVKAEKSQDVWQYSIMSIGFYDISAVNNNVSIPKVKKKV